MNDKHLTISKCNEDSNQTVIYLSVGKVCMKVWCGVGYMLGSLCCESAWIVVTDQWIIDHVDLTWITNKGRMIHLRNGIEHKCVVNFALQI